MCVRVGDWHFCLLERPLLLVSVLPGHRHTAHTPAEHHARPERASCRSLTLGVGVWSVSCARVWPLLLLLWLVCSTAKAALLQLNVVQVLLVLMHSLAEELGLALRERAGKRALPAVAPGAVKGEAQAGAAGEAAQAQAEGAAGLLSSGLPVLKTEMDGAVLLLLSFGRAHPAARLNEPAHRLVVHRKDGLHSKMVVWHQSV